MGPFPFPVMPWQTAQLASNTCFPSTASGDDRMPLFVGDECDLDLLGRRKGDGCPRAVDADLRLASRRRHRGREHQQRCPRTHP